MRTRALVWLVGALVVTSFPASAAEREGTDQQCRQEWADLAQLHGENGNPRGPVPALAQRWDAYDATAEQYAGAATAADCGALIASFATTWDNLEALQYDLDRYDPLDRLAGAEADRKHALQLNHVKHLSPKLERAFRVARRQAPRAARDLAPALAPAATVNTDDPAAVHGVLRGLAVAARHSHHQQRLNQVLRVIGNAELHEE